MEMAINIVLDAILVNINAWKRTWGKVDNTKTHNYNNLSDFVLNAEWA
jgi:hypothetical protein